jgi:hypothetical protein
MTGHVQPINADGSSILRKESSFSCAKLDIERTIFQVMPGRFCGERRRPVIRSQGASGRAQLQQKRSGRMKNLKRIVFLSAAAMTLAACAALANNVLLPKGTPIPVTLLTAVSSRLSKVGDMVRAKYDGDPSGGFPVGTTFVGKITQVSPKSSRASGTVTVVFTQAVLPNNKKIAIVGTPQANKNANANNRDPRRGLGQSAGIGAIGGMLLFNNNLTGAIVGGATGAAVRGAQNRKPTDVEVKSGTPFLIVLTQSATVPAPGSSK